MVIAGVLVAHGLLFASLSPYRRVALPEPVRGIDVVLVQPDPPPDPPAPPRPPAPASGGRAPAAPSRVHTPPPPSVARPVEIIAPPEPAPEPALTVGLAPVVTPDPGTGRGETGTGTGTGSGAGDGPGNGGTPPRFVRGPTRRDLAQAYPRAALAARQAGHVLLRCRIRPDTRLEGCRVIEESPTGAGFGAAALRASTAFRFHPPTVDGRPRTGFEMPIGIDFIP
tara:strand:+ start:2503 stop:3177 length:675 start_codon:yes stop_codon:yes gene_type:complete